jgi:hypothetical protein
MMHSMLSSKIFRIASTLTLLSLAAGSPVMADGSNTSDTKPTPGTPTKVVTQDDQKLLLGTAQCAQQYDLWGGILEGVSLGATTSGVIANGVGLAAEAVGEALQPATNPLAVAGVLAQGAALSFDIADLVTKGIQYGIQLESAGLPNCDATFTGTVTVDAGGVNVTGGSLFNGDVGVDANVVVSGDIDARQVHATQGISAHDGAIWIGDPGGGTYSSGITIGGGAVSGAGTGGSQAFTGDVDAIAIGNGAQAMTSGSVALGLDSNANGEQDVVIGALNNTDVGGNNTVVGNEIDILGATSSDNTVLGVGHQVTGSGNFVGGDPNTVVGSLNVATGVDSNVTGDSNVAIGDSVNIAGDRAVAVGNNATANADDTTAIGTGTQANATGSAAFGQGAVANQQQQQVFGTAANTYTTPGITSDLSKARQSGSLEVTTTDALGNLASDGGMVFTTLSENQAGIAIAMAMTNPTLATNESFGVALNWGVFERSHALAFSAMGVVARDLMGAGERISLTGGFGLSVKETSFGGNRADTVFGGRAGVQLSW